MPETPAERLEAARARLRESTPTPPEPRRPRDPRARAASLLRGVAARLERRPPRPDRRS